MINKERVKRFLDEAEAEARLIKRNTNGEIQGTRYQHSGGYNLNSRRIGHQAKKQEIVLDRIEYIV